MGERTGIAWTDHTFNPWWGCTKVSPGCASCYAEVEAKRRGQDVWGPGAWRRHFTDAHWREPLRWNRQAEKEGRRHRVFCASMADVFEAHSSPRTGGILDLERSRLWDLIERTHWLDWQLLTKRPENIARMVPRSWVESSVGPPSNVWFGTSGENQEELERRLPHILAVPARVRFLSLEPLLGPIDLLEAFRVAYPGGGAEALLRGFTRLPTVHWAIVGGESGARARPCHAGWIRDLSMKSRGWGIPVFVKQMGSHVLDRNDAGFLGDLPSSWPSHVDEEDRVEEDPSDTGYQGAPVRIHLRDRKGADPAEWPEDLRVQEFPR